MSRYRFAPASQSEQIVFGAQRPGYNSTRVGLPEVLDWIAFMKEQGIQRVCCLLPQDQLNFYETDLLGVYRSEFGNENLCWAPIEDFHLCSEFALREKILPFLKDSDDKQQRVAVHCSGGSGRTGHVLAAWLVFGRGFPLDGALSTVKQMNRNPYEAVQTHNATRDDLYRLLGGCTSLSVLSKRILECTECEKLSYNAAETVRPYVKPCAVFDIYARWKPNPLNVVFIAEAPPGGSDGYFYDPRPHPGYKEILRMALFELLELSGADTGAKLAEFKRQGYFLLDAIKCRCKKGNGQPPRSVTKTCARRWLGEELDEIGNPRKICVLGKAALLALSQVNGFETLTGYSVTKNCGKIVDCDKHRVLIWPFLGWRHKHVYDSKASIFKEFGGLGVGS